MQLQHLASDVSLNSSFARSRLIDVSGLRQLLESRLQIIVVCIAYGHNVRYVYVVFVQ